MDRPSPVPTSPDAKWVLVHVTGSNTLDAPPKGSLRQKDVVAAPKDGHLIGGKIVSGRKLY